MAEGAHDLASHVEQICEDTGHERIHVVGHSLGGLIARYFVQRLGGDLRVGSLVIGRDTCLPAALLTCRALCERPAGRGLGG